MSVEDQASLKQSWYQSVDQAKVGAIANLLEIKNGLAQGVGLYAQNQKDFGLDNLSGKEHFEFIHMLEKTLINTGGEGQGLIGEILAAESEEDLRACLSQYATGHFLELSSEASLEQKHEKVLGWMSQHIWSNVSFAYSSVNKASHGISTVELEDPARR